MLIDEKVHVLATKWSYIRGFIRGVLSRMDHDENYTAERAIEDITIEMKNLQADEESDNKPDSEKENTKKD